MASSSTSLSVPSSGSSAKATHVEMLRKRVAELVEENEELKRDKRSFRDASDQLRRDLDKAREDAEELKKKHEEEVNVLNTRLVVKDEELVELRKKVVDLEAASPAKPASKRKPSEEGTSAPAKKRKTLSTAKEKSAPANVASSSTAAPDSTAAEPASEKRPSYSNPWGGMTFNIGTASSCSRSRRLRERSAPYCSLEHLGVEPSLLRARMRESLRPYLATAEKVGESSSVDAEKP